MGDVVFDLETMRSAQDVGGWGNIHKMGLALAVLLDVDKNEYKTYFEKDAEQLVEDLFRARRVIGYNHVGFDYRVLTAYTDRDFKKTKNLDLLMSLKGKLGFRLKLNDVAQATLGVEKSADGLQSLQWFKEGKMDLIEEYCKMDVEVTAKVWRFGKEKGYVLFPSKYHPEPKRVEIDWR